MWLNFRVARTGGDEKKGVQRSACLDALAFAATCVTRLGKCGALPGNGTTWLSPIQGARSAKVLYVLPSAAIATHPTAPPISRNSHCGSGGASCVCVENRRWRGESESFRLGGIPSKRCIVSLCCNSCPTDNRRHWQPGMCAVSAWVRPQFVP